MLAGEGLKIDERRKGPKGVTTEGTVFLNHLSGQGERQSQQKKKKSHFWPRISKVLRSPGVQKGTPPLSQDPKVAVYTTGSAFTAYFKTNLCHFLTRKVALLILC